jgi:hypothetical protein
MRPIADLSRAVSRPLSGVHIARNNLIRATAFAFEPLESSLLVTEGFEKSKGESLRVKECARQPGNGFFDFDCIHIPTINSSRARLLPPNTILKSYPDFRLWRFDVAMVSDRPAVIAHPNASVREMATLPTSARLCESS